MIGFMLRLFALDTFFGSIFTFSAALLCSICALCGFYKLSKFRIRDCFCIKWCMRASGTDEFDDFEVQIVVHEATYVSTSKRQAKVRVTAGKHKAETSVSSKGFFHEALVLFVEQGTGNVTVELVEKHTILASLKLNVMKDILKPGNIIEQEFRMNAKARGIAQPKLKLTFQHQDCSDIEKSLVSDMQLSKKTEILLQQHIRTHETDSAVASFCEGDSGPKAVILTLAGALKGRLERVATLGERQKVYAAVLGPPAHRKFTFSFFHDEKEFNQGVEPILEIDLMKIVSVQEDPSRSDYFYINYVDAHSKSRERVLFQQVDMAAASWVEITTKIITLIREERDAFRREKAVKGK